VSGARGASHDTATAGVDRLHTVRQTMTIKTLNFVPTHYLLLISHPENESDPFKVFRNTIILQNQKQKFYRQYYRRRQVQL
jgi:hypothetical protein